MGSRKTCFSENESGIFFARDLDSRRRFEVAGEIRRLAQAFSDLFVCPTQAGKNKIAQVICPTCRIGHTPWLR
jgi:hypothetical protein